MRKKIWFLPVILTLSAAVLSADEFNWDLLGKVPAGIESCCVKYYDGIISGRGYFDATGNLVKAETVPFGKDIFTVFITRSYSKRGKLTEQVYYKKGEPSWRETTTYKSSGIINSRQQYLYSDEAYILDANVELKPDADGNIGEVIRTDSSGTVLSRETISYNADGIKTKSTWEKLGKNGDIKIRIDFVYNELGHVIEETFSDPRKGWNFSTIYKYTYNEQNLPIRIELYEGEDQETPHWGFLIEYN